jgi:hypothetical protein
MIDPEIQRKIEDNSWRRTKRPRERGEEPTPPERRRDLRGERPKIKR